MGTKMILSEPERKLLIAVCWIASGQPAEEESIKRLTKGVFEERHVREAKVAIDNLATQFARDTDQVAKTVFNLILHNNLDTASPVAKGLVAYMQNLQCIGTMLSCALQVVESCTPIENLVSEDVTCNHCSRKWIAEHPACESLVCPGCGKRVSPPSATTEGP